MSKTSLASKFAGLMNGTAFLAGKKTGKAADGEDTDAEKPTKREGETDEEFEKRLKEWEDSQDDGESAEGPKDTSDDDQDKEEKMKKAKADGIAEGTQAEKARWSAVLSSPAAIGRVVAACTFLDNSDMSAEAITKALAAMPAEGPAARSTTRDRMAEEKIPAPSVGGGKEAGGDPDPAKAFAASVTAAAEKARGKKAA